MRWRLWLSVAGTSALVGSILWLNRPVIRHRYASSADVVPNFGVCVPSWIPPTAKELDIAGYRNSGSASAMRGYCRVRFRYEPGALQPSSDLCNPAKLESIDLSNIPAEPRFLTWTRWSSEIPRVMHAAKEVRAFRCDAFLHYADGRKERHRGYLIASDSLGLAYYWVD